MKPTKIEIWLDEITFMENHMVLFQKSDNRAQHICTTCFPKFAKKAENVLKRCVHVEMQNLLKFTIQDGYAEIQAENKNW